MQKVESDKKNSQHSSTTFHGEQDCQWRPSWRSASSWRKLRRNSAWVNEGLNRRWGEVSRRKRVSTLVVQSRSFFELMRSSIWSKEKRGRLSCSPASAASMNTPRLSCARTMRYSPIRSWASMWSGASTLPRCCCTRHVACHAIRLSGCNLRQRQHSRLTSQWNCRLTSEFFFSRLHLQRPLLRHSSAGSQKEEAAKHGSSSATWTQWRSSSKRIARGSNIYTQSSCSDTFTTKLQSAATVKSFSSHPLVCCSVRLLWALWKPTNLRIRFFFVGWILACRGSSYVQLFFASVPSSACPCTPAEATVTSDATFCIAGSCFSVFFVGVEPPQNTPSMWIMDWEWIQLPIMSG